MAVQVAGYQGQSGKQRDNQMLGTILPVAGTVAGSIYGGPVGGAVGGAAGSLAAQQVANSNQTPEIAPIASGGGSAMDTANSAVARRQQQLQDAEALADAQSVVARDPKLQKQFGSTLASAQQQNALQRYQNGNGGMA